MGDKFIVHGHGVFDSADEAVSYISLITGADEDVVRKSLSTIQYGVIAIIPE